MYVIIMTPVFQQPQGQLVILNLNLSTFLGKKTREDILLKDLESPTVSELRAIFCSVLFCEGPSY